ncbi:hypothetical protein V5799_007246 [Amblyomma americanum]|uniref:Uncharacterized protein n=1 Tax=Amblyomma americanum TaxID=6943 RepID=A0AAQ4DU33_AMBAM
MAGAAATAKCARVGSTCCFWPHCLPSPRADLVQNFCHGLACDFVQLHVTLDSGNCPAIQDVYAGEEGWNGTTFSACIKTLSSQRPVGSGYNLCETSAIFFKVRALRRHLIFYYVYNQAGAAATTKCAQVGSTCCFWPHCLLSPRADLVQNFCHGLACDFVQLHVTLDSGNCPAIQDVYAGEGGWNGTTFSACIKTLSSQVILNSWEQAHYVTYAEYAGPACFL